MTKVPSLLMEKYGVKTIDELDEMMLAKLSDLIKFVDELEKHKIDATVLKKSAAFLDGTATQFYSMKS